MLFIISDQSLSLTHSHRRGRGGGGGAREQGELKGVLHASLPAGLHLRHHRADVAGGVHSDRPGPGRQPEVEAAVVGGLDVLAVVPGQRGDPELGAGDRRAGGGVDDLQRAMRRQRSSSLTKAV